MEDPMNCLKSHVAVSTHCNFCLVKLALLCADLPLAMHAKNATHQRVAVFSHILWNSRLWTEFGICAVALRAVKRLLGCVVSERRPDKLSRGKSSWRLAELQEKWELNRQQRRLSAVPGGHTPFIGHSSRTHCLSHRSQTMHACQLALLLGRWWHKRYAA